MCSPHVRAATEENPAPDPQALYRDALQSIAEGRQNDAADTLQRVIDQEPLHAGAWLDLALIQCGLGHTAEAERLFTIIEQRFAPPDGIMQLITDARQHGCNSWTAQSQYSLSVGRGIDQNVNQGSRANYGTLMGAETQFDLAPEFRPKHDQFSVVSADYMRDLSANGSFGYAQFQSRRNDHLHQYDSDSLFAGAEMPWRWRNWSVKANAMVGVITLGGQYYQRQFQTQLRLGPPQILPYSVQFNLLGSLTRVEYMTLDNFDATTGELRAQLSRRGESSIVSANFGILDDRADSARPGGNRHGLAASAQWRQRLPRGITTELGYSWQSWHSASPYAPGVIDVVRRQYNHSLRAAISYPLSKQTALLLEARAVHNQENVPIFQYNGRLLQLSWQWQGP
nr:tetratricopeptide repeat protein [Pseudoduganella danionis]